MTAPPRPRPYGPPPGLTDEQRDMIKRAGYAERRVWQVYSAPVARELAETLRAYIDLGFRFETRGRIADLVDDILARPVPARTS